ncbi:sulfotransferase (plasmid) [Solidesulfovibrio carbinoliphilus subsp. oakridgensis]|uniref:Sulfotransferase n=1 Tax=Solidesulfovibrio carbinoliphilus subsp. oakridgensis TaxID=694327 RepID=G7QE81_9BACT|nr:sulfotransferase [Solidesulfovibrio carbinoliphilus]EHJ45975.1 sulfotransferase [Solidesulfovibrio carbinoliphilus subsp. oakridgensis]
MPDNYPIFIGGMQRSGTSLMRAMLGSNSRLAIFEWDLQMWPVIYSQHREMWGKSGIDEIQDALLEAIYTSEKVVCAVKRPERSLVEACIRSKRAANEFTSMESLAAGVFQCFLDSYRDLLDRARWGLKTPENEFYSSIILREFPDAKFVYIYRNIVSAAASTKKIGWMPYKYPYGLLQYAMHWNRSFETAWENCARHPDRYVAVCYELLTEFPDEHLKLLCAFLDLPYEPAMLALAGHGNGDPLAKSSSFDDQTDQGVNPQIAKRKIHDFSEEELQLLRLVTTMNTATRQGFYKEYNPAAFPLQSLEWLVQASVRGQNAQVRRFALELMRKISRRPQAGWNPFGRCG